MTQTSSLAGLNLGVVGAGVMGQGIAQVALLGELNVQLIDVDQAAADRGKAAVRRRIERLAEKGSLAAADASAAMNRLRTDCRLEALSGSDAVIEAVFEDLTIKRQVFGELERVASKTASLRRIHRPSSSPRLLVA